MKDATPVYVGNLPTNIKRVKLVKLLKKYGKILSIRFRTNTGKSFYKKSQIEKVPHLIAFVYFDSREAAEASVQSNGEQLGDNVITVDIDYKDKSAQIKPQNTVVIGNLKYGKWNCLQNHQSKFDKIKFFPQFQRLPIMFYAMHSNAVVKLKMFAQFRH